jgi:hypothetical protein
MWWSLPEEVACKAVSVVIALILGTQLVVGFVNTGRWGWPMVAYPMYKQAHFEGDRFDLYNVYAVLDDGTRLEIAPADVAMDLWMFRRHVMAPIQDGQLENLAPITALYCERVGGRLVRFEIFDRGIALGWNGPVYGLEPQQFAAADVACR